MERQSPDNRATTTIEPAAFELAVNTPNPVDGGSRWRLIALIAITATLALVVAGVVFVLPKWIGSGEAIDEVNTTVVSAAEDAEPNNREATVDQPSPSEATTPAPSTSADDDPQARENTQQKFAETLEKLQALEALAGDQWAKAELHQIRERIAEGEKAYREKRYVTASNIYLDTSAKVDRLLADVPNIVENLIESGNLALAQGQSAAASEAFQQVLQMDSTNQEASAGLARAGNLDQVLALIAEAEGYERLGQTKQALAAYQQALTLDQAAPGAKAALQRIGRDRKQSAIQSAMSAGFKALKAEQFDQARSAFQRAEKLDRNRDDIQAALKQVDNAEANYHIEKNLAAASAAAREERWSAASKAYAAALKHDPRLSPAIDGQKRADMRARLDGHLKTLLAQPERLSSNAVHAEASKLLASAQALGANESRIKQQIAALQRALELAKVPLNVTIYSDGATQVAIYKVGELGGFEQRQVSLLPGNYTIVGTRDGYRDVRVELRLRHDQQLSPLTVQCQEKIASGN